MVWKATTSLGCARSTYIGTYLFSDGVERTVRFTYLVARYSPAGNVYSADRSHYAQNVGQKASDSSTCILLTHLYFFIAAVAL